MKIETKMCHSHLMSMLMMPEQLYKAVSKYVAFPPDMPAEGMIGYMETYVEFDVKSLDEFTKLWNESYKLPSDRTDWYHRVKSGMLSK
jgi:hypothetical protein